MIAAAIQIHIDGIQVYPVAPKSRNDSLTAAARSLGVTREHLSRVLHGHRISASLTRRFWDLSANPNKKP